MPALPGFIIALELVITFRRSEITRPQAAGVDDDFLEHNGRIDHPDLERVISRLRNRVNRSDLSYSVFHGFLPIPIAITGDVAPWNNGLHPRRLVIKGYCYSHPTVRHEVQA